MQVRKPLIAVTATSALVVAALAGAGSAGATPAARKALDQSTPAWLGKAHKLGGASSKAPVDFRVYLAPRGGTATVEAAVKAVSTPGSATYHKYLSPAQYHQRYNPTAQSVATVRSWLAHSGLTVRSVAGNNAYLRVTGSVAKAKAAFNTDIARFQHDGQTVQANTKALTIPAAVSGSVLAVTGIDTSQAVKKPASKPASPPSPGFNNARPCSTYYGQLKATYQADYATALPKFKGRVLPYAVCGYTGPQFRAAYEGNTKLTGAGVSVGIVDAYASPTIAADANRYARQNGDGSYRPGQLQQTVPSSFTHTKVCDASGWYGEETLDVEAVHAMAPDANIHFYASRSCYDADFVTAITKVVDENKVSVVTNSYGEADEYETTGLLAANHAVFLQAALQGISFLFSSGDNGDELANTAIRQTDSSASDPAVTAVGGTSTAIGIDGSLKWQTGWGTEKYALDASGKTWDPLGFIYGAGGGYSKLFNRPGYQQGVVPPLAQPGRAVPDVAMDADPTTGMLVGQTQAFTTGVHYGEYRIGGTSLASPLFAGMTALLTQNAQHRLGFLNPMIYKQARSGLFDDVKGAPVDPGNVRVDYVNGENPAGGLVYSVRTFDQDSSLTTVKGWDDVTGVGVPNAGWLTSVKPAV